MTDGVQQMFYIIYKVTNLINGKYYIGKHKTVNLNDGYMGSGKLIKRAIAKYGIENFRKDVIRFCENEQEMNDREKELVVVNETTYNLCPGGHGGFGYINKNITAEQKQIHKARKSFLDKVRNDSDFRSKFIERCQKSAKDPIAKLNRKLGIRKSLLKKGHGNWLGKQHTDETKEKMSHSHRGKHVGVKNSQYGTSWVTDGVSNLKISKDAIIPSGWRKGRTLNRM